MNKFYLAAFLFVVFCWSPLVVRADGSPPVAPLNGQWKGPLKLMGGQITLIITIVPLTNGSYYAALDAPQQRIARMPVEVELSGDKLRLRIEQAGSSFEGKVLEGGATLSGTWKQPGLSAPLVLRRAAAVQAAATFKKAPPYRETDVSFINPTTRQRLSGTLTVPAGEGPFAAVALLSDSGPQSREVEVGGYRMFGQLADYLGCHGVAVLRFDDRGVGKSGGTYATATTPDLVTDARAALAFLRGQSRIAAAQVGLVGHGEGANVALLTAAGTGPGRAPAFVVSLAGYGQRGYDVLLRQQGEIMRLIGADPAQVKAARDVYERTIAIIRQTPDNGVARPKVAALLAGTNTGLDASMARARAAQLTSPWSRYFFDFDPRLQLPQVQCAVLLLNGTADLQVSARRNLLPLQRTLSRAGRRVSAARLTGVNHLFQPPTDKWPVVNGVQEPVFSVEALQKIHGWVVSETRPPGDPLPITVKRKGAAPRKPTRAAAKTTGAVRRTGAANLLRG